MVSMGNSPNIWLVLLTLKLTFCHVLLLLLLLYMICRVRALLDFFITLNASSSTYISFNLGMISIHCLLIPFHNLQATHLLTRSMSLDYPLLPLEPRLHIQLADRQDVESSPWLSCLQ